jgi:hypothetical protein
MEAIFSRTWQRPPTAEEVDALVSEHIRDEVIYREAIAMGLDRDDAIIRRRMRQKMEFVADLSADVEPTDVELKSYVSKNPERFRSEPRFFFNHVYFPAGAAPEADELERLVDALNGGTADASIAGSAFLAGLEFRDLGRSAVAQAFGESFASSIERTTFDGWAGPVTSAFGTHLVRVSERTKARDVPFEEVREAARREWLHARKVAANEALYERLRSRYVVTIEDGAGGGERVAEARP